MKDILKSVRNFAAILIVFGSFAGGVNAAILMTITDNGTDLTMTATGTYDFSSMTPNFDGGSALGANAMVGPSVSGVYGWETGAGQNVFTVSYSGVLIGSSFAFPADSTSVTIPFYFVVSNSEIRFSSTTPLVGSVNESAIFSGTTVAGLGMVAGESVTITWAGDSATIQTLSIPEPSSTLTYGVAALGFLAVHRRRL